MSLFQCENCGCVENTAVSMQGFKYTPDWFCWDYNPKLKGKLLCSACGPAKHSDGTESEFGQWHDVFDRKYLPMGMFKTNRVGNLVHIETGEEDYTMHVTKCSQNPKLTE